MTSREESPKRQSFPEAWSKVERTYTIFITISVFYLTRRTTSTEAHFSLDQIQTAIHPLLHRDLTQEDVALFATILPGSIELFHDLVETAYTGPEGHWELGIKIPDLSAHLHHPVGKKRKAPYSLSWVKKYIEKRKESFHSALLALYASSDDHHVTMDSLKERSKALIPTFPSSEPPDPSKPCTLYPMDAHFYTPKGDPIAFRKAIMDQDTARGSDCAVPHGHRTHPEHPAIYEDYPDGFPSQVSEVISKTFPGSDRLYSHQSQALRILDAGGDIVLATRTSRLEA